MNSLVLFEGALFLGAINQAGSGRNFFHQEVDLCLGRSEQEIVGNHRKIIVGNEYIVNSLLLLFCRFILWSVDTAEIM